MEEELRQAVLEFIGRLDPHHAVERRTYHASSVFSCFRRNWYKQMGVAATNPLPLVVFEKGRRAEDILFESMQKKWGSSVMRGAGVSHSFDGWKWIGKTDILINREGRLHDLLEVKSTETPYGATFEPTRSHFGQVSLYASRLLDYGLQRVFIVQMLWNTLMPRVHQVTEAEVSYYSFDAIKFFERLDEFVREEKLPPAAPFNDYECESRNGTCPFLDRCRADGGWKKIDDWGAWVRISDVYDDSPGRQDYLPKPEYIPETGGNK